MNKRIMLLTTPFRPNIGGVETHLDDLILEGTRQGYKFIVLTYQPLVTKASDKTIEKGDGFAVYRLPWIKMNLFLRLGGYPVLEFLYLFPGLFFLATIFLALQSSQVDVVHAQGLVAGAIGVIVGKIFKKPVIISTHSIYNFPKSGLYSNFVRLILNGSKHILALSQQSQKEITDLGVPHKKVSVFTYWVNQNLFKPMDKIYARKRLRLPMYKFICLFVGRLVPEKGIQELLSSAKITQREITFLIVGDGPMAKEVRIAAKKSSNVIFRGKVENKKLCLYYNAADVLLVPSIHDEGFGRVILESLSCGLPVVAANRGGIREAISDKVGVLIDITVENIKTTLENLYTDRGQFEYYSKNSVNYAKTHFGNKNSRRIFSYYEE